MGSFRSLTDVVSLWIICLCVIWQPSRDDPRFNTGYCAKGNQAAECWCVPHHVVNRYLKDRPSIDTCTVDFYLLYPHLLWFSDHLVYKAVTCVYKTYNIQSGVFILYIILLHQLRSHTAGGLWIIYCLWVGTFGNNINKSLSHYKQWRHVSIIKV